MRHKPDCPWYNGFKLELKNTDPEGLGSSLEIDDRGIAFQYSKNKVSPKDKYINFKYCPMCGGGLAIH